MERMKTLRPLLALLAALVLGAVPAAAHAADSHAPHGARGDWLPADEWVMSQWLPYDEATLDHLLQTNRDELASWLDDQRTLGALARKRGFRSQRALAKRLAPAPGGDPRPAPRRAHARRPNEPGAAADARARGARHPDAGPPRPPRPLPHLPLPRDRLRGAAGVRH